MHRDREGGMQCASRYTMEEAKIRGGSDQGKNSPAAGSAHCSKKTPNEVLVGHSSSGGDDGAVAGTSRDVTRKRRGRCKWFNVAKGWGFITPDDEGQDVFVHQSVIKMSGFRSLGDEEEVEFECKTSDKGLEATHVTGPEGSDCAGSHRRPQARKRYRKIRCYNCGEFANHIAAKCSLGPQPKRCHSCKSEDHLIADCPSRKQRPPVGPGEESNNGAVGDSLSSILAKMAIINNGKEDN